MGIAAAVWAVRYDHLPCTDQNRFECFLLLYRYEYFLTPNELMTE